jgi:hypothetical protein
LRERLVHRSAEGAKVEGGPKDLKRVGGRQASTRQV